MVGDLLAQLAARSVHITAEFAAHGDIHTRLLQNADERLEMLRRRRPERALFHVAATRAVDRLYVSCSDTPGEYLNELIQYEKDVKAKAKKTK